MIKNIYKINGEERRQIIVMMTEIEWGEIKAIVIRKDILIADINLVNEVKEEAMIQVTKDQREAMTHNREKEEAMIPEKKVKEGTKVIYHIQNLQNSNKNKNNVPERKAQDLQKKEEEILKLFLHHKIEKIIQAILLTI